MYYICCPVAKLHGNFKLLKVQYQKQPVELENGHVKLNDDCFGARNIISGL